MRNSNLDKIKSNLIKILKSNEVMLVLKDNAYGFGIENIIPIAKKLGISFFAVKCIEEGKIIRKLYPESEILVLGKCREYFTLKKYNLIGSINDYDDYVNFKENGINMHLEIDLGMNRFGVKSGYLPIINDKDVTYIYTHIYSEKDRKIIISEIESLAKRYNKKLHIGGSLAYGYTNNMLRIGRMVYDGSISFTGNIINIKRVYKGESVGYDSSYYANEDILVGVCDVGYSNGLNLFYGGRVFINGYYYKVIGKCCMDCCFILIDDRVNLGDEVEFFGNKIHIDDFCLENKMSKYEAFFVL